MKEKVLHSVVKSLPVVSSIAVGVGVTLAIINRDKIENKLYDKLTVRQITKENIPLQ
tara:strand:- start:1623 stop:1793 length:171 start_codon:yes stop_codon:yes gene_type:complete